MRNKDLAFYLRLSVADGDLDKKYKDESNSIENQRVLLNKYVEENDNLEGDVREYIDDGYTGSNFKRPGFQRMLKDAGKGEISVILVKDLSRLGRDYIGVGDYVEQIFPMFGVRFIAVNNNFDSASCIGTTIGMDFAVNNLINDLYCRDVSKKTKSSLETIWRQGRATQTTVPFGYCWNKDSERHWEIDPVSSAYVRKVFDYALRGDNTSKIATELNTEHIPTPGVYAKMKGRMKGEQLNLSPDSEKHWGPMQVWNILNRYEYTGALVMRKRVQLGSEHLSTHTIPKEDQIVVEDMHDAIVTLEEFNEANNVIRKKKSGISFKSVQEYPLKGMVRCGNCRRMMKYSIKNGESGFYCAYGRSYGSFSACPDIFFRESEINTRVMYAIRQVINFASVLGDVMEDSQMRTSLTLEFPDPGKLKSEIEILKAERVRQYEAYADRVIDRNEYQKKKAGLADKIGKLEEQLKKTENYLQENEDLLSGIKEVSDSSDSLPHGVGLTAEVAQKIIESVYIYDENRIEIVFKCEGVILKAFDKCTANTDGVLIYPTEKSI